MTGMFARSKAGHDKNKTYVILKEEDGYVFLADGIGKTIDHPKKKKLKHIQLIIHDFDEELMNRIKQKQLIQNEEIKRAIRMHGGL